MNGVMVALNVLIYIKSLQIAEGERKDFGDITTLADSSIVDTLIQCFQEATK